MISIKLYKASRYLKLLIIDDSEIDRLILKHKLETLGFEDVVERANGTEGLDYLIRSSLDEKVVDSWMVFLDLNMPLLNGFEFLSAFEQSQCKNRIEQITIAMYTSSSDFEDKAKAMSYDFVKAFLTKGVASQADISDVIEEHQQKHC